MLYYSPQIWCSDDTDAIERLSIQEGTSLIYPLCSMGGHVSGYIKYILVAAAGSSPVWNLNCPVWMGAVQVGIRRDHFRLKPDTKFHAKFVYLFYKAKNVQF